MLKFVLVDDDKLITTSFPKLLERLGAIVEIISDLEGWKSKLESLKKAIEDILKGNIILLDNDIPPGKTQRDLANLLANGCTIPIITISGQGEEIAKIFGIEYIIKTDIKEGHNIKDFDYITYIKNRPSGIETRKALAEVWLVENPISD